MWLVLVQMGLMTAYTPTGSYLYDRLIAVTETQGTATFLIYIADLMGNATTVIFLLARPSSSGDDAPGNATATDDDDGDGAQSYAGSFQTLSYTVSTILVTVISITILYLRFRLPWWNQTSRLKQATTHSAGQEL